MKLVTESRVNGGPNEDTVQIAVPLTIAGNFTQATAGAPDLDFAANFTDNTLRKSLLT